MAEKRGSPIPTSGTVGSMHSRTSRHSWPSDSLVAMDFQLMIPFTSRSFCMTGSCEKSFMSMSVVAPLREAFGSMEVGVRFAASISPIRTVGSIDSSEAAIPSTASGSSVMEIVMSTQARSKSGTVRRSNSASTCLIRPTFRLPRRRYPNQLSSSRTVRSSESGAAPPSTSRFMRSDNAFRRS